MVIALGTRDVQVKWEQREKAGDAAYWDHVKANGNAGSYEDWMHDYRRKNRLRPPGPFERPGLSVDDAIEKFRAEVKDAVFGEDGAKPICHRPVKRKLIGALHEETLFGPVLDADGGLSGNYTAKKSVLALTPNHLRMPRPETEKEAVERAAVVGDGRFELGDAHGGHAGRDVVHGLGCALFVRSSRCNPAALRQAVSSVQAAPLAEPRVRSSRHIRAFKK